MFGKHHTQAAKDLISQKAKERDMSGERNPFYGKRHTDDALELMRESKKDAHNGSNNPNWKGGKIKRICQECGKEFEIKRFHIKNNHGFLCSRKCCGLHLSKNFSGKNSPLYEEGSHYPYCELWTEDLRERVRAWFGYQCFECGTMSKRLCVHHVWWNKNACCDDSERTLVPLCAHCHASLNRRHKIEKSIFFQELIDIYYGGKCWLTRDEFHEYYGVCALTWKRKRTAGLV